MSKAKNKQKKKAGSDCALDTLPDLLKHVSSSKFPYRKNGYCVISGSGDKPKNFVQGESNKSNKSKIYAKTATIRQKLKSKKWKKIASPGSDEHVSHYYFDYGNNFKNGKTPYTNQGHHIIPHTTSFSKFSGEHMAILKKVDYNVNNGNNIIFLPKFTKDCGFHKLPHHNGPHGDYTDEIRDELKEIEHQLKEIENEPCEVIEPLESIKKYFYSIQDNYWQLIVAKGKIDVNDVRNL